MCNASLARYVVLEAVKTFNVLNVLMDSCCYLLHGTYTTHIHISIIIMIAYYYYIKVSLSDFRLGRVVLYP